MSRLPTPGSDNGTWGNVLNDFLGQSHSSDGTLKAGSVGASQVQDGALPKTKLDTTTQASLTKADGSLQASNNLSDVTAGTARTNLGLGTAATMTPATLAADGAFSGTYAHWDGTELTQAGVVVPIVYQVNVKGYGAKGDCQDVIDGAMSSGSAVLTSASNLFTANDVGKHVLVRGGGVAGADLHTTVASYQSSGQITLAANASSNVTGGIVSWGTDDTAAIQAAINAAVTYAQSSKTYATKVFFPLGGYMIARQVVQGGANLANAQIALPMVTPDATHPKVVLALIGESPNASAFPNGFQKLGPRNGVWLLSPLLGQTYSATYGTPSVIGGWTPEQGAGWIANFSNMLLVVDGLSILVPANPTQTCLDIGGISQCALGSLYLGADFTLAAGQKQAGANDTAWGVRMPLTTNNDLCTAQRLTVMGMYFGVLAGEHTHIHDLACVYNTYGVAMNGAGHPARINHYSGESNTYHLTAIQGRGTGTANNAVIYIENMECEHGGSWIADIIDTHGWLYGEAKFTSATGGVPVISGAANFKVMDPMQYGPGHQIPPAVPASTTALVNPFWRDCAVTVSGGTVTVIAVDGTATGINSGTVIVPSGKTITLTYSVTPSWVWVTL